MKFLKCRELDNKFASLRKTLEENIVMADLYTEFLEVSDTYRCDEKNIIKSFCEACDLDPNDKEIQKLLKDYRLDQPIHLKTEDFKSDPYYQNIKIKPVVADKWRLTNLFYKAYEAFVYLDTSTVEGDYREYTSLAYFDKKFLFPAVIEGDEVWMSIMPHETLTQALQIKRAHGKVLTYGLGLGYYAYMAALKPEVESVTIVERDPAVIDLFKTYLLPQFPMKHKIKVIECDAFEYVKNRSLYDYTFIDLWHTVDDGLPLYMRLKAIYGDNSSCDYWIEDSMLVMLRRYLISLMLEEYEGVEETVYQESEDFQTSLFNRLHAHLKDLSLTKGSDIDECLSFDNIRKIVTQLTW